MLVGTNIIFVFWFLFKKYSRVFKYYNKYLVSTASTGTGSVRYRVDNVALIHAIYLCMITEMLT